MAKQLQPNEVLLKNVRLSFADIFEMKSVNEGKPRYSANFLLDPESEIGQANIKAMKTAIKHVMQEKWQNNQPKLKADKFLLRDGNEETWDGYAGVMYVSAANYKRFPIIDFDRTPLSKEDGKPYSGCYVDALVRVWAQDNEYGKRVNGSLELIRFRKDGEPFGAAPVDPDDIDFDDGDDFGGDDVDLDL